MIELFEEAGAYLHANRDLAEWAAQVVTGNRSAGGCLLRRIGGQTTTTIRIHSDDQGFSVSFPGTRINVGFSNERLIDYVDAWSQSEAEDRVCAAVELSASLLHELTHFCWRGETYDGVGDFFGEIVELNMDESGECDNSYRIENSYRWAAVRRWSQVQYSACCGESLGADLLGADFSVWMDRWCIQRHSGGSAPSARDRLLQHDPERDILVERMDRERT